MQEYRRFVAYFYEYIDGKKQKNVGFAKVELRNGIWRILFRLTAHVHPRPPVEVSGFVREGKYLLAFPMGTMRAGREMMEDWAYHAEEPIWLEKYGMEDLSGIWIQSGDGRSFITVWDDEPFSPEQFVRQLPGKKAENSNELTEVRDDQQEGREHKCEEQKMQWENGIRAADTEGSDGSNHDVEETTKRAGSAAYSMELQKVPGAVETSGRPQEGLNATEASGRPQEGLNAAEAFGRSQEGLNAAEEVFGRPQEGLNATEASGRPREGLNAAEASGRPQEGLNAAEASGRSQEGLNVAEASGRSPMELNATEIFKGLKEEVNVAEVSEGSERKPDAAGISEESGRVPNIIEVSEKSERQSNTAEYSGGSQGESSPAEIYAGRERDRGMCESGEYSTNLKSDSAIEKQGENNTEEARSEINIEEIHTGKPETDGGNTQKRLNSSGHMSGLVLNEVGESGTDGSKTDVMKTETDDQTEMELLCEELYRNRAQFQPFMDTEISRCIRIMPCDIVRLQRVRCRTGRNSFLLHGYHNYRHLMLGMTADGNYVLGVPGIMNPQEKYMAVMFGFPNFKYAEEEGNCQPYGYWYRILQHEK